MNVITNISSFTKIKPEYQKLLNILQNKVENRFRVDLCAYYLLGSVGRGEDKPGISDMDTEIILRRSITDEDEAWAEELKSEIEPLYPTLYCLDLGFIEEKEFEQPQAKRLRFIFKTDSVLICGQNITASFSSLSPGLELAKLLNQNYRQSLENARRNILELDKSDLMVMEYVRWISKKTLRLCLGIVMVDQPFYTRLIEEMTRKFAETYPIYQSKAEKTLQQYYQPTNDGNEALDLIMELTQSIYKLADKKL